MDINGQSVQIPMDSQLLSDEFNILSYVNGFDPASEQTASFLDGTQTVQVLGTYVEVESAELLQSNQADLEPKLEDLEEPSYDVNFQVSVEEFTSTEFNFKVKIAETGRNESYTYSNVLNKIYTSIEKHCTFEASFNSYSTILPIIRVMMVCANAPFQPLSRCAYHTKNDTTANKNHVVVRRDGSAEYIGMPEGETFRDRLALKIAMGDSCRKNITLEFKCLSSCYKIKKVSTALVFTLEDPVGGQLLGREIIPIQISKNFKRDMETAEKAAVKRTGDTSQKRKQAPNSVSAAPVAGSSSKDPLSVDLNLNLPRSAATDFLKYAEQFFAAKLYGADASTEQELMPCLKKIRLLASDMEQPKDQ
ncbi:cellular tumor antigen p53 [Culex quinquefasciatus]|uniref:cellular tumor antigen p53 n=1 Tax=Culex quinquefasciatus TaxID=7176 RepID=UPI0018E3E311|nr:cellular tumor antigen p53 [Culex quinquefasciatus]XP_038112225.1 cellular tumor antigen p53 [Culex quinquefasciatus]XP_038112231.1 cellular tumor antigen p53 [Culex quinquefasciatus]XP_038112239.1 cellular tumor antigen p53 [Culex quinquefasciatus]